MTKDGLRKEIEVILKKKEISTASDYVFDNKITLYEIILEIENKTGLLANIEQIFEKDVITNKELLNIFYKEYERERRGY